MQMFAIVVGSAILLLIAYNTYGRLLARLFQLNDSTPTPANTLRDDLDFSPCETAPLLSQHFSAIAAAGPIVGPILAGLTFGWLPALIWILCGSILIGGVHDFGALVASIRHRATSIIEVVRIHVSGRAYLLFLAFVWLALVYIVVAFTDITARMFVGAIDLETNTPYATMADAAKVANKASTGMLIKAGGVASSSLIYLMLPLVMGLVVRAKLISMDKATWIFLPLVALAIWGGQYIPVNVDEWFRASDSTMTSADASMYAVRTWDIFLLIYCVVASMTPMWLLLQPRGQLGGYFMYAALGAAAIGIIMGGKPILQPAFLGWTSAKGNLTPMLFIMIACGACSGFHSLIASGTTSKQLNRETSAKPIGYGTMLLEAMVAIVSLCCVMMLPMDSPLVTTPNPNPSLIYANGIGSFLAKLGLEPRVGIIFALVAFNTFVFDTLDVCTRLGRFIIQELTGWRGKGGRLFGTLLTAGVPAFFVTQKLTGADGKVIPAWRLFWDLFGASNQLLAALTLLGITVWLWRTRRAAWVLVVTGLPAVFMYVMSSWALTTMLIDKFRAGASRDPVAWIAVLLLVLAVLMLLEGIAALVRRGDPPASRLQPVAT